MGDSLYACKPVFDICQKNRWAFIFTFKRGSMPALFAEFETLRDLAVRKRVEHRSGDMVQQFAWVNDLDYQRHRLSAFQCIETRPQDQGYFAWITNLPVGSASIATLSNQGWRLRWKIENEGFNTQKNGGYELEHAYSTHEQAAKIFYLLLQVAHALNQLMIHGSLCYSAKRCEARAGRLCQDLRVRPQLSATPRRAYSAEAAAKAGSPASDDH